MAEHSKLWDPHNTNQVIYLVQVALISSELCCQREFHFQIVAGISLKRTTPTPQETSKNTSNRKCEKGGQFTK